MPQIKSTLVNVLLILVGAPLAGAYYAYLSGEVRSWGDLPKALNHGAFAGFFLAIGWLLMKSPYSSRIMELLSTKTSASGAQETTAVRIETPTVQIPQLDKPPAPTENK